MITMALALMFGGQEFSETLAKPLAASISSPKQIADLELCVVDQMNRMGVPVRFQHGQSVIIGARYVEFVRTQVFATAKLTPSSGGTVIELRFYSKRNNSVIDAIKEC